MTESAMTEKPTTEDLRTEDLLTVDLTTEDPTTEDLLTRIKRETNERLAALRGAVEERDRLRADLLKVDPPVEVDLASEEAVDEVDAQAQLYEWSI
jgi:hypothetical protein